MLNYVTFFVISAEMIYTSYIDSECNHISNLKIDTI